MSHQPTDRYALKYGAADEAADRRSEAANDHRRESAAAYADLPCFKCGALVHLGARGAHMPMDTVRCAWCVKAEIGQTNNATKPRRGSWIQDV